MHKRSKLSSFFRLTNLLRAIAGAQPLSLRGLLALFGALALIKFYALPQSDLVAHIIGGSLFGLVLTTAIPVTYLRFRLRRKIRAELRFDSAVALSRREISSGIILFNSSLAPYLSLIVKRHFQHPGAISPPHIVRGRLAQNAPRHLLDSVYFPHRGLWKIDSLQFELCDVLGLSRMRWQLEMNAALEVSAPAISIQPLPIVAASSQSGDQFQHAEDRSGDLFDIKAYDPSDGIKRILWKAYAKSGSLVVRRPEPALVPEGEVGIFLVARREDEHVVGALQHYLRQLHDHNIVVLFGTDGFPRGDFAAQDSVTATTKIATQHLHYCSSEDEIIHAINRSVWSEEVGTGLGFSDYLDDLKKAGKRLHRAVVFVASDNTGSQGQRDVFARSEEKTSWFANITRAAETQQVELSLALVPRELDLAARDEPVGILSLLRLKNAKGKTPQGKTKVPLLINKLSAHRAVKEIVEVEAWG